MPKAAVGKFYAVRSGRQGPQIYDTLEECQAATSNYSGSSARRFSIRADAQAWLDDASNARAAKLARKKKSFKSATYSSDGDQIMSDFTCTSQSAPARPLGAPVAPARTRQRIRYSYPISDTEWTEYVSPLQTCELGFFVDSVGDRTLLTALDEDSQYDDADDRTLVGGQDELGLLSSPAHAAASPPPIRNSTIPTQIKLSQEQQHVLDLVRGGQSCFFTGPAGTGKSVLLREVIKLLRGRDQAVAITASTGIAGLNIGGSTVHSWAGIGLGKEAADVLAQRIKKSFYPRMRWQDTDILIIDEISMLDGTLFDKLVSICVPHESTEHIARIVRNDPAPFGGMQLIVSGDFFQLPPVPDQHNGVPMPATYAFDALAWHTCVGKPVVLSRVFRQKENEFIDMLSSMRMGVLTPQIIERFNKLSRPVVYDDGIEASVLFPLRAEVEGHNNKRLRELPGRVFTYHSMDSRGFNAKGEMLEKEMAERLLERLVARPLLALKMGSQVMLIKNIVQGRLVNGSLGKVTEFLTTAEAIKRNIAISTLDRKGEQHKQPQDGKATILAAPVKDLMRLNGRTFGKDDLWPLVKFTNGMELVCAPVDFSVEGLVGNVEALRLQTPLILAWALSIHKSQGQTLSRVKVDLDRIFEKGQAYVALSRATTMETLEVVNFQPSKVLAHPRVLAWQETWAENTYIDERTLPHAYGADTDDEDDDDVMNCEDTMAKPRSLWDLSECAESLSEIV